MAAAPQQAAHSHRAAAAEWRKFRPVRWAEAFELTKKIYINENKKTKQRNHDLVLGNAGAPTAMRYTDKLQNTQTVASHVSQRRTYTYGDLPTLHLSQRDQNVAGKQGPEGPADAATRLRAAPRHPTGHGAL